MNPQSDPLAQLHDIHLPDAISWWPLAPGWWLLALALLLFIAAIAFYAHRHWQRNAYRRSALKQLAQLEDCQNQPEVYLSALNRLLKKTLLAASKPQPVSLLRKQTAEISGDECKGIALCGSAWLEYLNATGNTDAFSSDYAQLLAVGPYSPQAAAQASPDKLQQLHNSCKHWLSSHRLRPAISRENGPC